MRGIEIFEGGDPLLGIFLAAFSYVAALTGAGLASGQEVLAFFSAFSRYGVIGIAAASVLIGAFGGAVSEYALHADIGYEEMTARLFSCRGKRLYSVLVFAFSVCTCAVMCACFGSLFEMMGLSSAVGSGVLAAACAAVLICGGGAAVRINAALGAAIFICAASVCLYLLGYREHQAFRGGAALASGVTYAGYNLISVGTVLASGRMFLKRKGDGFLVGFASAVMVFVLLTLMWAILCIYEGKINLGELPIVTLALRESKALAAGYSAVIAAAVFTTGISSGMCAAEHIAPYTGRRRAVMLCMAAAFVISGAGFSALVNTVYRYCGMVGIFAACVVIYKVMRRIIAREERRF